jgi:hypothetical protein
MVRATMNSNAESEADDDDAPLRRDGPVYGYRPNLMGSPWVFRLTDQGIAWEYGRRSALLRYDQVRRVRMSYRPATMQTHRFITEIWGEQSPKVQISSTSFRGLMEQQRQDADYAAFVGELHRRLAASGSGVRFEAGMNRWLYWLGSLVMLAIAVALVGLMGRTAVNRDVAGFAVVAGVVLLFAWQVGTMFYRNRPLVYRPEQPPPAVLPRV